MPKIQFELDMENLLPQALAAYDAAGLLLFELAKVKGPGPWRDDLMRRILARYEDMPTTGDLSVIGLERTSAEKAARDIVKAIFDRVSFTDDHGKATHIV